MDDILYMKQCTKCLKTLSTASFSWKNKAKKILSPVCKSCQKIYRDNHYLSKRESYIKKAKTWRETEKIRFYNWLQKKSCVDCGNNDFRVLEFDHLEDKDYTIATKIGTVKLETLLLEINKCDIVCANCHRIRTAERGKYYTYLQADKA